MNGVEIESQISFGEFLADEVEKFEICLFDVHDLSLISGLELDEVIQYLRNLGKPGADSIAIETGCDYCLDGQKIVQAVGSIKTTLPSSTTSIRRTPTGGAKSSLIKMEVEPKKNENIDEWTGENEPLSFEFLQLILVQGRMAAKREKEYGAPSGKGPAAQAAKRAAKRGLPMGAISQSDSFVTGGNSIYFTGKFNRAGRPALWLEASPTPPPQKVKALSEKKAFLQGHLDEMYRREPSKSHTKLCDDLAMKLNVERGPHKRPFMAVTIRRITDDPGHRAKGCRLPRLACGWVCGWRGASARCCFTGFCTRGCS